MRGAADLTIDDSFLVAKRIALGPLLDMTAAFLDALDSQYELFVEVEQQDYATRLRVEPDDRDRMTLN